MATFSLRVIRATIHPRAMERLERLRRRRRWRCGMLALALAMLIPYGFAMYVAELVGHHRRMDRIEGSGDEGMDRIEPFER